MQGANAKPESPAPDAPVFDALIVPQRSLSSRGFAVLMAFLVIVSLAVSVPFYLLGAWPVLGFFGLDVVLIYCAFRYHNATARAYERIVISRIELLLRSVSWRGKVRETRFNPAWVRIERAEHPEFGTERVEIVQGTRRVEVAGALGREERGEFADAFQKALSTAKRG
ncbi:COG5488 Integral membrane protein [Rhabdaerophilaceae bacterium]